MNASAPAPSAAAAALVPPTLQHYPPAPALRPGVQSYFSAEGRFDASIVDMLGAGDARILLFDLGDARVAWMLRRGTRRHLRFKGPLFGAVLKACTATALPRHGRDGAFAARRLLLQLRAAPSMAFRIVALDLYLGTRLATQACCWKAGSNGGCAAVPA